jgi:hypothetical protein
MSHHVERQKSAPFLIMRGKLRGKLRESVGRSCCYCSVWHPPLASRRRNVLH